MKAFRTLRSLYRATLEQQYLKSLEPFSYDEPLEGRNIRLVQLLEVEAGRPIQCKLVHRPLDRDTQYQALSYVWGNSGVKESIDCNGRRLEVTANLHAALIQLCAFNEIRENSLVWIDAICIDQGNITEKTAQIKMMREIYAQASYTIIWLGERFGPSGDDLVEGAQLMKKIYVAIAEEESTEKQIEIAHQLINGDGEDPFQNSLEIWKVLMRDWFGRIWVVQEFVASSACLVYIGQIIVSPGIIFQVANILCLSEHWGIAMAPYARQLTRANPLILNASFFWSLRNRCRPPNRMKLHDLVRETMTYNATVPHDGIFALVGLACDVGPEFIDYSLAIRTVYINIAKNALRSSERGDLSALDFLTCVRGDSDEDETVDPKLPSWAPNLRRFDLHKALTFRPLASTTPSLIGKAIPGPFTVSFGLDESLQLKAAFLDTVATVLDAGAYSNALSTSMNPDVYEVYCSSLKNWEVRAHNLAMSLERYPTGEDLSIVYPKTLSFDYRARNQTSDGRAAGYAEDYALFQELLDLLPKLRHRQEMRTEPQTPDIIALDTHIDEVSASCRSFVETFDLHSAGRCLATTKNGFIGWVPEGAQQGDDICMFQWSLTPFVVRKLDRGYCLIGACFVEALMKTENLSFLYKEGRDIKIF